MILSLAYQWFILWIMKLTHFEVIERGARYALPTYLVQGGVGLVPIPNSVLEIRFACGFRGDTCEAQNGIAREALLAMLLDDLAYLNETVPSSYNEEAQVHLQKALECLEARQQAQTQNGTLTTQKT